jgi:MFS transporter, DHA3 family, macrolide efflux protein
MLLMGIALGLLAGLALGGRLRALVNVRLRFAVLLVVAIVLRYGTQALIAQGVAVVDTLRWPLYAAAFGALIGAMWLNRARPGLLVVLVGVGLNGFAILVNGGWMPVYEPAIAAAGLSAADLSPTYHVALPADLGLDFLLHAGPLGDVIPFPAPLLPNVVSLGDVVVAIGLGWFVFATLMWGDPAPESGGISLWSGPPPAAPRVGERPVVLGAGVGPGFAPPVAPPSGAPPAARPLVAPVVPVGATWRARLRGHPYVRLAHDSRFSAFWVGQTISVFGDRLNQVALASLVLGVTESPLLSGLVFIAAMIPNLFLSPIAGTLVDRWDQKHVMVASDLLRAALVLLIPFAADIALWLVYPIIFLVTTVSLFFRPARSAVLPRIVDEEDLLPANGAMWTGETLADIGGYPIAGLLVAFLGGGSVALAFWLDAATYVISALILAGLVIPPVVRTMAPRIGGAIGTFVAELRDGWRFLRDSPPLFQNTLISTVGQLSLGATLALTPFFVLELLGHPVPVDDEIPGMSETFGALEAALGLGNLIGGFVVGAIGTRLRKGGLVIGGFVLMGLATVMLGLSGSTAMALVAALAVGAFNLVWLIPSQTLFGELVPSELMGRVVAMRGSMVFGAMTASAAVCSVAAQTVPTGTIFAVLGAVTVLAGLLGTLLPAVRDA